MGPQLQFLEKFFLDRPSESSLVVDIEKTEDFGENMSIPAEKARHEKEKTNFIELELRKRRKDLLGRKCLKLFEGVIKSLNNFDKDEILEFQFANSSDNYTFLFHKKYFYNYVFPC